MANNYLPIQSFKEGLPDEDWTEEYNTLIDRVTEAASRVLDVYTRKPEGYWWVKDDASDETRYFESWDGKELWFDSMPALPTSLEVAETGLVDSDAGSGGTYTTWAATDYFLHPTNALKVGRPYEYATINYLSGTKTTWYSYPRGVKITGVFGFHQGQYPHPLVTQAVSILAIKWFKRFQSAFQDTGAIPELGQLVYTKALDPDFIALMQQPPFSSMTI